MFHSSEQQVKDEGMRISQNRAWQLTVNKEDTCSKVTWLKGGYIKEDTVLRAAVQTV